jgi:hypothetical protein
VLNHSFWNELGQDGYAHCFETLLFGNFVTGCTILMNPAMREHFLQMPEDVFMHDAWLALIAFSFGKAGVADTPLVKYRRHEHNVAFVPGYRKRTGLLRWLQQLVLLLTNKSHLDDQFRIVRKFMQIYGSKLTEEHRKAAQDFLRLEHASYLRRKLAMRRVLKQHPVK